MPRLGVGGIVGVDLTLEEFDLFVMDMDISQGASDNGAEAMLGESQDDTLSISDPDDNSASVTWMPFGKQEITTLFSSAIERVIEQSCVISSFYFMSLMMKSVSFTTLLWSGRRALSLSAIPESENNADSATTLFTIT